MLFFLGDEFFIGRLGDDGSRSAVEARAIDRRLSLNTVAAPHAPQAVLQPAPVGAIHLGSIVNTASIVVMVIIRPIVVVIIVRVIIRSIVVMIVVRMIIRPIVVMVVVRAAVVAPIIIVDVLDAGGRDGAFERRRREREGGRGAAQDHEHCRSGESAEHAA
jgi:hypothetical protein